ncbi:flavodoxin domain-containing protein [Streptomyces sp. TRM49041]|uniref:flavodoxin domain-containing protein n=1 Tax=Streptomyces sp. TRM49041 TaxID=2603216 RepID=UPI0021CCC937|nr:flavodoxin domain-containing protein [Streptomyces sp. TRM49041]
MIRVLVGYATAHGSTLSVAERVATRLAEAGAEVETKELTAVSAGDLAANDAYVIGSAVHDMAWLPEARDFVDAHTDALTGRALWIFSVGMPDALPGPRRTLAGMEEKKIVGALRERLRPRGHRLFSGVIRPEHLSGPARLKMRAMGVRYGDYRDWAAVDGFAHEIAEALHTVDSS